MSRSGVFFFLNDTATTEIYTLSLHDALPISAVPVPAIFTPGALTSTYGCATEKAARRSCASVAATARTSSYAAGYSTRSEEHTSELQSRQYLVCRLLLEKKKAGVVRSTVRLL